MNTRTQRIRTTSRPEGERRLAGGEARNERNHRITQKIGARPGGGAGNVRWLPAPPSGRIRVWEWVRGLRSFLAPPPANFPCPFGTGEVRTEFRVPCASRVLVVASRDDGLPTASYRSKSSAPGEHAGGSSWRGALVALCAAGKSVAAGRRDQHAGRVWYPDPPLFRSTLPFLANLDLQHQT